VKINNHPNLKVNDPVYRAAMELVASMPGLDRLSTQDTRFLIPGVRNLVDALVSRGMVLDNNLSDVEYFYGEELSTVDGACEICDKPCSLHSYVGMDELGLVVECGGLLDQTVSA
jgi:hypothetical protein